MWIRPVASGANALGDLSSQYWNVAQSNLRTQEGDIARANAAQQGWNGYRANVANLERSDEATQYGRQQQADQIARRNFEWGVGRADRAKELDADFKLRREQFGQRRGEDAKAVFAGLQSAILDGKVLDPEEAWAFIPKTPDNVLKVTRLFDKANSEKLKGHVEELNSRTAQSQASSLQDAIKSKRTRMGDPTAMLTDEERKAAIRLDTDSLGLLARSLGQVDPRIRWDDDSELWTIGSAPSKFAPIMGNVRESEGRWNPVAAARPVTSTATAPAPRWTPPAVQVGRGGATVTDFSNQTNAPALRPLDINTAREFLRMAGGDKNQARELARRAGFAF